MIINDYVLDLFKRLKPISYDNLRQYFRRRSSSKYEFYIFRKIWATYMRREGIEPEIIDLLQGRVSKTVFARYYYRPDLKPLINHLVNLITEVVN